MSGDRSPAPGDNGDMQAPDDTGADDDSASDEHRDAEFVESVPHAVADIESTMVAYRSGRLDADTALAELRPGLTAPDPLARINALDYSITVSDGSLASLTRIVDELRDGTETGKRIHLYQTSHLRNLYREEPTAAVGLLDHFERVARTDATAPTFPPLAAASLGDLGATAPGVIRQRVPALCETVAAADDGDEHLAREGLAALARIGTTEPAVVRPFIAECVWGLDAENPETLVRSLTGIGRLGIVLPDLFPPLEGLTAALGHPSATVREAAAQAIGRVGGREYVGDRWLGRSALAAVEGSHAALAAAVDDPNDAVREAAMTAIRALLTADDTLVDTYEPALRRALTDEETDVQAAALGALRERFEAGDRFGWAPATLRTALGNDSRDVRVLATRAVATAIDAGVIGAPDAAHCAELSCWSLLDCRYRADDVEDPVVDAAVDALVATGAAESTLASLAAVEECGTKAAERLRRDLLARLAAAVDTAAPSLVDAVVDELTTTATTGNGRPASRALAGLAHLQRRSDAAGDDPARAAAVVFDDPDLDGQWTDAAAVLAVASPDSQDVTGAADGALLDADPKHASPTVATAHVLAVLCDHLHEGSVSEASDQVAARRDAEADGQTDEGTVDGTGSTDDDDGSEVAPGSVADVLGTIGTATPEAVPLVQERLVETVSARAVDRPEPAAVLAAALEAGTITLDERTRELLAELVGEDVSGVAKRAHAAAALVHADTSHAVSTHVRRWFPLLIMEEPDALTTLSGALESDPDLAAAAAEAAIRNLGRVDSDVIEAVITHPAPATRIVQQYENSIESFVSQYGGTTAIGILAEAPAETVPHVLSGACELPFDAIVFGEATMLRDWLQTATGRVVDDPQLDCLLNHPDHRVREQASTFTDRITTESTDPAGHELPPVAEVTTSQAVDDLAARLASPTAAREAAVRDRLVAVAQADATLRNRVVIHLLARVQALADGARRDATLEALVPLLDASPPEVTVEAVLQVAMHDGSEQVRRQAVAVSDALGTDLDDFPTAFRADLSLLLEDPNPVVRRWTATLIDNANTAFDDPAALVPQLVDQIDGAPGDAMAALRALRGLAVPAPDAVFSYAGQLVTAVGGTSDIRREHALRALTYLDGRDESLVSASVALEAIAEGGAFDGPIVNALLRAPIDSLDDPEIVEHVIEYLFTARDEEGSQAAATLFERLGRAHPTIVHEPLVQAAERFEDDRPPLMRTEYVFYRTAVAITEATEMEPLAALEDVFESTINRTTQSLTFGRGSKTKEIGNPGLTHRTLRAAAVRAAGSAGHEAYMTVLEEFPEESGTPAFDPTATARYLVRASPDGRDAALETLQEQYSPQTREATVAALVELDPTAQERRPRLEGLERLVRTDGRFDRRGVVDAVVTALEADAWRTRRSAVETLRWLARDGLLTSDEAIAHLLPLVTDPRDQVATAASEQLAVLSGRGELEPTTLVALLTTRARTADSVGGSCATVATLGRRYLRARQLAVERLAALLDAEDVAVRKAALRALDTLAATDAAAVERVAPAIQECGTDSDPNVRHYARECLSTLAAN